VVVRLFGPELDRLLDKAHEVAGAIKDVPGVVDLKVEPQVLVPMIQIRLKPETAGLHGLTAGRIRRAATTLVKGRKVGEVYEGQKVYEVAVWGRLACEGIRNPSGGSSSTRRRARKFASGTWRR